METKITVHNQGEGEYTMHKFSIKNPQMDTVNATAADEILGADDKNQDDKPQDDKPQDDKFQEEKTQETENTGKLKDLLQNKTGKVTFSLLGELGGLGAQLFQVASTIGIAEKNNCSYEFPHWEYAGMFANKIPQRDMEVEPGKNNVCRFNSMGYVPIMLTKSMDLRGVFASEKYFSHCADKIREYFEPSNEIKALIEGKYKEILEMKDTCSIHIEPDESNMFSPGIFKTDMYNIGSKLPDEYYLNSVKKFKKQTNFVVFGDINRAKKMFKGKQFTFTEGVGDIAELFLMAKCTNHIISASMYAWWGAWLRKDENKKVIAPSAATKPKKVVKTKYRIFRQQGPFDDCWLQFKDTKGKWRFVPNKKAIYNNPIEEKTCWLKIPNIGFGHIMSSKIEEEDKLRIFANKYKNINEYFDKLNQKRNKYLAEKKEKEDLIKSNEIENLN